MFGIFKRIRRMEQELKSLANELAEFEEYVVCERCKCHLFERDAFMVMREGKAGSAPVILYYCQAHKPKKRKKAEVNSVEVVPDAG